MTLILVSFFILILITLVSFITHETLIGMTLTIVTMVVVYSYSYSYYSCNKMKRLKHKKH